MLALVDDVADDHVSVRQASNNRVSDRLRKLSRQAQAAENEALVGEQHRKKRGVNEQRGPPDDSTAI